MVVVLPRSSDLGTPFGRRFLSGAALRPHDCGMTRTWWRKEASIRGPKDHISIRILHSVLKAQDKEDSSNDGL